MDGRGTWVARGLGCVLFLAPVLFGSVHRWAAGAIELALWTIGFCWAWSRARDPSGGIPRALLAGGGILGLYLFLQTLPLPGRLLEVLSPATAEVYRRAEAALGFPVASRSIALYPFAARSELLVLGACAVAFWVAATLPEPRRLLVAAVASGIATAFVAIVQGLTWNGKLLWVFEPYDGRLSHPRLSGPFVNPDHYAFQAEMALVVGAAWLLGALGGRDKLRSAPVRLVALGVGLATIGAALVGSASRGGVVGALIGLAVVWWAGRRSGARARAVRAQRGRARVAAVVREAASRLAPAAVVTALVVGGLTYAGAEARSRLDFRLGRTIEAPDLYWRSTMWAHTLPVIGDFPLFGVGLEGWREVFRRYQPDFLVGALPNHAHDDYVEWVAEVGAAGTALSLLVAAASARWAWGNRAVPGHVRAGILGAGAAVAWHEVFDFGLRVPANAILAAVLAGLLGNRRWREERAGESPAPRAGRLPGLRRALAGAGFVFLAVASLGEIREFLAWSSVRSGSERPSGTEADAETWYEAARRDQAAGRRYAPETVGALREALARRPAWAEAWWRLSRSAGSYEERLRALEAAIFFYPGQPRWRLARATMLNALGRRADALAEVEEAVARIPRLWVHGFLGRPETPEDVLDAAERGFRRAAAARPEDPDVLAGLASLLGRRGRLAEAAELWERAAELDGSAGRWVEAAEARARLGELAAAEEAARRAIAAEPARPEGYRTLALSVLVPAGRFSEAEALLERGLRRASAGGAVSLLEAVSAVRRARGDVAGSLEALARAAELRPRDVHWQRRLAEAYLAAGDLHRAAAAAERAIALEPRSAPLYELKGRILEARYELGGAREAYRKAAELDPKNPSVAKSLERVEAAFAPAGG